MVGKVKILFWYIIRSVIQNLRLGPKAWKSKLSQDSLINGYLTIHADVWITVGHQSISANDYFSRLMKKLNVQKFTFSHDFPNLVTF